MRSNKNPNAPASVTPALLLPQVERDIMGTLLGEAWGIGNIVIQHTSKNQFVNEDRYIWGDRTGIWNGVYDTSRDVNNIIKQSEALNDNHIKVSAWSCAPGCFLWLPTLMVTFHTLRH